MGLTGKRRAACQSGPLLWSPRVQPAPPSTRGHKECIEQRLHSKHGVLLPLEPVPGPCQALPRRLLLAWRSDKGAPPPGRRVGGGAGWGGAAGGSVVADLHCPC